MINDKLAKCILIKFAAYATCICDVVCLNKDGFCLSLLWYWCPGLDAFCRRKYGNWSLRRKNSYPWNMEQIQQLNFTTKEVIILVVQIQLPEQHDGRTKQWSCHLFSAEGIILLMIGLTQMMDCGKTRLREVQGKFHVPVMVCDWETCTKGLQGSVYNDCVKRHGFGNFEAECKELSEEEKSRDEDQDALFPWIKQTT